MKFRLIKIKEHDAFMNMALDEAIFEAVRDKKSLPTIRLYTWKPNAVSIGYFQGYENEVNKELCRVLDFNIVRRMTGGGAVVHENEITYSIIAPQKYFSSDVIKSYGEICGYIVDALGNLGISAEFKPINDVTVNGEKISGSAQTRKSAILWQHGTLLYNVDSERILSLLKGRAEKNKLTQSQRKIITCIIDHKNIPFTKVIDALETAFSKNKEIIIDDYTDEEMMRAQELSKTKYSTKDWNEMR